MGCQLYSLAVPAGLESETGWPILSRSTTEGSHRIEIQAFTLAGQFHFCSSPVSQERRIPGEDDSVFLPQVEQAAGAARYLI